MVIAGLGMAAFVPTLHAYLSARLPYSRPRARPRHAGILLGAHRHLRSLSHGPAHQRGRLARLCSLSSAPVLWLWLSFSAPCLQHAYASAHAHADHPAASSKHSRPRPELFRLGDNALSAYAAIGVSSFNHFAAVQLMIVYGAWFSAEYGTLRDATWDRRPHLWRL